QTPLRGWLYDYVAPLRYFRNAALFREYAMLCMVLLALLGLEDLHNAIVRPSARSWRRFAGLGVTISLTAIVIYVNLIEKVGTRRYWLRRELLPHANYFCILAWLTVIALCLTFLLFP